MVRFLPAVAAAAAMTAAIPMAIADEQVIIIDAPDVQKLDTTAGGGFRTSDVIGTEVYSNGGKRIGEVEDFAFSNGYLYAVVDVEDGPIEPYLDLNDGDMVVIPWNQLRVASRPAS